MVLYSLFLNRSVSFPCFISRLLCAASVVKLIVPMSDIENQKPVTTGSDIRENGASDFSNGDTLRPPFGKSGSGKTESKKSEYRIFPYQPSYPRFRIGSETLRGHTVAALGEFCGTFMFLWCAYVIAQIANNDVALTATPDGSHPGQLIMIALGFGFSVMFSICALPVFLVVH